MSNLNSARLRYETPHLNDALKRRAQSIINDKSIDAETRVIIHYGLEINDPWHFPGYAKSHSGAGGLVTEGTLKADTVVRFRPNAHVIATSGVTCSHSELVKAARPYTALIAFDADYRTNPAVCRQLARLIVQRLNDSRELQIRSTTNVLCWNGPKGIDDAVRANVRLRSLTISEWYAINKLGPLTWKKTPAIEISRHAGYEFS